MKIPAAKKLPFSFNADQLASDLRHIESNEWIKHYRSENFLGDWEVVPLRSVAGHPAIIYATPAGADNSFYKNTPILERCAYFKKVIHSFECQVNSTRLMKLCPGAKILEHTDYMGSSDTEEVRIHIPIITNADVVFKINGNSIPMKPGEAWIGNFTLPHSVENNGVVDRIHLVLDCNMNDWLSKQIIIG